MPVWRNCFPEIIILLLVAEEAWLFIRRSELSADAFSHRQTKKKLRGLPITIRILLYYYLAIYGMIKQSGSINCSK